MARRLSSRSNGPGHNSGTRYSLRDYRDAVAELMRQQKGIGEEIKELCAQCDEAGMASKREIRQLARESLRDQDVFKEHLDRMAQLRVDLGVFASTPLGEATIEREETQHPRRGRPPRESVDVRAAREALRTVR